MYKSNIIILLELKNCVVNVQSIKAKKKIKWLNDKSKYLIIHPKTSRTWKPKYKRVGI